MDFYHYRVDVYTHTHTHTHCQHTFMFKQQIKWILHPMTPLKTIIIHVKSCVSSLNQLTLTDDCHVLQMRPSWSCGTWPAVRMFFSCPASSTICRTCWPKRPASSRPCTSARVAPEVSASGRGNEFLSVTCDMFCYILLQACLVIRILCKLRVWCL